MADGVFGGRGKAATTNEGEEVFNVDSPQTITNNHYPKPGMGLPGILLTALSMFAGGAGAYAVLLDHLKPDPPPIVDTDTDTDTSVIIDLENPDEVVPGK